MGVCFQTLALAKHLKQGHCLFQNHVHLQVGNYDYSYVIEWNVLCHVRYHSAYSTILYSSR